MTPRRSVKGYVDHILYCNNSSYSVFASCYFASLQQQGTLYIRFATSSARRPSVLVGLSHIIILRRYLSLSSTIALLPRQCEFRIYPTQ